MGKHAAPEGAAPDPLVSAALEHRTDFGPGAHSEGTSRDGAVGWPGTPAPEDGGLGWPGDLPTDGGQADQDRAAPAAPAHRRGWRRLFGLSRVA